MLVGRWLIRGVPLLAILAAGDPSVRSCLAQPAPVAAPSASPAATLAWTPLVRAMLTTVGTDLPTLVVVTSPRQPASLQFCKALAHSPEAAALAGSLQFAELSEDIYPEKVKELGVQAFPTLIVYVHDEAGTKVLGTTSTLIDPAGVVPWLRSLGFTAKAPCDSALIQVDHYPTPSGQAYPTEQAPPPYAPPKQPMMAPPPAYSPPPQVPQYAAPPPQQQYMAPVPAPAPVYLQTSTPTMVVQQAPQQIILAPPGPPQVTVAMAPSAMPTVSYAPVAGAPMASAPMNLFTQPAQAPPSQPAQAPVAMAPYAMAPAPVAMAPAPAQAPVAMAPAPAQAPMAMAPAVGQGPLAATALTMILTNPSFLDKIVGTIGEHFAQKKNPRIQMGQAPTMAQAPVAQAPVGYAPQGYAPQAYAPVGYAAAPYAAQAAYAAYAAAPLTPEATMFSPCNTFRAFCKFHNGPCPGPGPEYAAPAPPYPAPSPQGVPEKSHPWRLFHR